MGGKRSASEAESEWYEVKEILQHRYKTTKKGKSVLEYLVRWDGYSSGDDTWEPDSNFPEENFCIASYWEEQKLRETNSGALTDGKKDKKNKEKEKPQNSSTEKEGKKENASRRTHSLQLDITPNFKTHEPRKIIGVRDTGSSLQFRLMWNPNLGEESSRIVSWHSNSELRKETPQLLLDFYEEHLTFEDRSK